MRQRLTLSYYRLGLQNRCQHGAVGTFWISSRPSNNSEVWILFFFSLSIYYTPWVVSDLRIPLTRIRIKTTIDYSQKSAQGKDFPVAIPRTSRNLAQRSPSHYRRCCSPDASPYVPDLLFYNKSLVYYLCPLTEKVYQRPRTRRCSSNRRCRRTERDLVKRNGYQLRITRRASQRLRKSAD